jgi:hypothetical protein
MPYTKNNDGSWSEAKPVGPQGPIARAEWWMRDHGHHRIALWLGRLDELGLGGRK